MTGMRSKLRGIKPKEENNCYCNFRILNMNYFITLALILFFYMNLWFVVSLVKKRKAKSKLIERLMNFRNQYIAHHSLKKVKEADVRITLDETKDLLELLMEI